MPMGLAEVIGAAQRGRHKERHSLLRVAPLLAGDPCLHDDGPPHRREPGLAVLRFEKLSALCETVMG